MESLTPVLILIGLLVCTVLIFGDAVSSGPNQIVLMTSAVIAAGFAFAQGATWTELKNGILKNIGASMEACLILLVVGALIGTWILGGIVPALVVAGLQLLSPSIFLFASCLICAIISLATGSSWSTAGTVGIALVSVGDTIGINPGMTAGAILSGAYFGDKMSPFSDTTNLAPAMAGTDLFTHIRHMIYTTGPSIIIASVIFLIMGFFMDVETFDESRIESVVAGINSKFNTSWFMLLPLAAVIFMVAKKIPALPALTVGTILGGLFAILFQPEVVKEFSGTADNYMLASFQALVKSSATGYAANTGIPEVDSLISRGGMSGMMNTIWLIFSAMMFGGVMDASGMLQKLAEGVLRLVRGVGSLIAATILTCIGMNVTASDQYLSLVITGRMYREAYEKRGLHPKNLSRALEDAGTITSPLVPWNTCGAFMSSTLGVATLTYLPFCFFNLINPLVSVIYGFAGITIEKLEKAPSEVE